MPDSSTQLNSELKTSGETFRIVFAGEELNIAKDIKLYDVGIRDNSEVEILGIKYFLGRNDSNIRTAVDMWCSWWGREKCFNRYGHISMWNVSDVTNMESLFERKYKFNDDIGGWDVRNVGNMWRMFHNARNFNQDLSGWGGRNPQTQLIDKLKKI